MSWLDVAMGAIGGGAAVGVAEALFHWRRGRSRSHPEEPVGSPSVASAPPAAAGLGPATPNLPPALRPGLSEGAYLAGRVVLHLSSMGRLGQDEVAVVGFTQGGMCEAMKVGQGTLAKTLARLEGAGVVQVDRRHVSGAKQRLKVYRLTSLGESIARDLVHRARSGGGSDARMEPSRP